MMQWFSMTIALALAGAGLIFIIKYHYQNIITLTKKMPGTILSEDKTEDGKKSKKKRLADNISVITAWIILHIALWFAWPEFTKYILAQSSFWAFQGVFIFSILFMGQFKITIAIIRSIIWIVVIVLFFTAIVGKIDPEVQGSISRYEETMLSLRNKDMIQKIEMASTEALFEKNKQRAKELKRMAENPNSRFNKDPNCQERKELEKLKESIPLPSNIAVPPKDLEKNLSISPKIIVKEIYIPANTIVDTGIKRKKGDRIEYEIISGHGGCFWIINKPENIKVTSSRATKETYDSEKLELMGGEIDVKVRIKKISGYYRG